MGQFPGARGFLGDMTPTGLEGCGQLSVARLLSPISSSGFSLERGLLLRRRESTVFEKLERWLAYSHIRYTALHKPSLVRPSVPEPNLVTCARPPSVVVQPCIKATVLAS